MKAKLFLCLLILLITACTPALTPTDQSATVSPDLPATSPAQNDRTPTMENPLAPQPGDSAWERGNVFIEESGLMIRESYPPQISLALSGNLPTPCHQLRVQVSEPDQDNKINVDAYTVTDPNVMCTQVLKPFSENISLGTFPAGHYSVWVNGESVGEFDS